MDLHALTAAPFAADADVATFMAAFNDGSLPRPAWNHRAHLTVALTVARRLTAAERLPAIRRAILRYNAAAGIESTPDSGYHETLTVFYMQVVELHVLRFPPPASVAEDANLLYAEWGDRELPLRYYTRERLFSREARAGWLPPDLRPLPAA
jgi:hypothetical protein